MEEGWSRRDTSNCTEVKSLLLAKKITKTSVLVLVVVSSMQGVHVLLVLVLLQVKVQVHIVLLVPVPQDCRHYCDCYGGTCSEQRGRRAAREAALAAGQIFDNARAER
jgi:hypothetical protein